MSPKGIRVNSVAPGVVDTALWAKNKAIPGVVETIEQQTFLRDHACDEMQGFLFSKPLPPQQMADMLRTEPLLASPPLQPDAGDARESASPSRLESTVV